MGRAGRRPGRSSPAQVVAKLFFVRRRRRGRRRGAWRRLRARIPAALLVLALAGLWISRSPPPPDAPDDLCAIYQQRLSWYRDSRDAAARWAVAEPMIMAILFQESGLRATIRPPRRRYLGFIPGPLPSSAYGYAQAVDATWRQFQVEAGRRASRRSFTDAVEFVAWYSAELVGVLGLSRTDVESLYLAYHEGPGGYARGSHLAKPEVRRSARRVAARAARFESQLASCRSALDRRLRWHAFGLWLAAAALAGAAALVAWRRLRR